MDAVLLFALPLVGGLLFCSHWNFTRWRVAREEGHRLYFRAVFYGALIFALVAAGRYLIEEHVPQIASQLKLIRSFLQPLAKDQSSAAADLAITCFVSMLSGLPLAWLLNLVFWKSYWLKRAIHKDVLEAFLLKAAERETSIAVTMDDHKVYVGYVVEASDPAVSRKYISLLPLMSGYRDKKTHKLQFTSFYTELYGDNASDQSTPLPPPLEHLTAEDFTIALSCSGSGCLDRKRAGVKC